MTIETNDTTNVDWAAIEAGLKELRRRPDKLGVLIGDPSKHYRQQLRLSAQENAMLKLIGVSLMAIVGRGVTQALIHRLSLDMLAVECTAALRDPAASARLKARLLQVREQRRAEHA